MVGAIIFRVYGVYAFVPSTSDSASAGIYSRLPSSWGVRRAGRSRRLGAQSLVCFDLVSLAFDLGRLFGIDSTLYGSLLRMDRYGAERRRRNVRFMDYDLAS